MNLFATGVRGVCRHRKKLVTAEIVENRREESREMHLLS